MSISSIRERKLFKKKGVSLAGLLTDNSQSEDEKENFHMKTEVEAPRESYSSRPTLNSNHNIIRELVVLEKKVKKEEAISQRYFEEMESLDIHHVTLLRQQSKKHEGKMKEIEKRIEKQRERNKKGQERNQRLIETLALKLVSNHPTKEIKNNFRAVQEQTNENRESFTIDFIEAIKCELAHKRAGYPAVHKQLKIPEFSLRNDQDEETLNFGTAHHERESESILLDDSFITR